MTKTSKIAFPKANRPIGWPKEPASFVAFGDASADVASVQGALLLAGAPVGKAKTLRNPGKGDAFWIIAFEDVPYSKKGETYTLEVRENGTLLARREHLTVVAGGTFSIHVIYPTADETVCPNFAAQGNTDESGSVTAKLIKGSAEVAGTPIQNGPNWVVSFLGVTPDAYDKLHAQVNTSSDDSCTNVVVNSSACLGSGSGNE